MAGSAAELVERGQLLAKLAEVERCVDGRGSCRDLVGPNGVLVMRSFPANVAGVRGGEQFLTLSKRELDPGGRVPVKNEAPILFRKEFASLTVGGVAWLERSKPAADESRCVVDSQGKFCPAARNRHSLRDLIRDARDAIASPQDDFQIVPISDREWLLSKWASRYSGFPLGSYMVLSHVGEGWQVSAFVVLL